VQLGPFTLSVYRVADRWGWSLRVGGAGHGHGVEACQTAAERAGRQCAVKLLRAWLEDAERGL
jgi:putative effector of murein hydrolase